MTLPVWCFAKQVLYCAFQEAESGMGEKGHNTSNNDNREELQSAAIKSRAVLGEGGCEGNVLWCLLCSGHIWLFGYWGQWNLE